jgi:Family of unknown function (DUF5706)
MEDTPETITKEKKKKKKKESGGRTAETMFRTTLSNLVHLSNIADNKAGLMISVNSIIISIMVSFMVNQYAANPMLLWPTFLLVLVCLLTIMYSILATKPTSKINISKKKEDLDLLFFADYATLTLAEYKVGMQTLISSDANLHEHMIANMYAQGHVLTRKFKLLKIAYTIFMIGFPTVIVAYLVVLAKLI